MANFENRNKAKKSPAEDATIQTSFMDSKTLNINSPLRVDIRDDKTASEVYYDNIFTRTDQLAEISI